MVGKEKLFSVMEKGLSVSRAPQTEIVGFSKVLRVVRFANSVIHQPMEERNVSFFVRVLREGRIGFSSLNGLDEQALGEAIKKAELNASMHTTEPVLETFAKPIPVSPLNGHYEATWGTSTDVLEDKVKTLIEKGKGTGVSFAGVFWTLSGEVAVLNSNGVRLYSPWTGAHCQTVSTKGELTGYAAQSSPDVLKIHPEVIAEEALEKTLRFQESKELPPGEYTCLLSEYAISELLLYLAHMTFTADAVEEGRSVLGDKKGKKIADTSVSFCDDALNPLTFSIPFDVEGVPKKKVEFIQNGIAKDAVSDLMYAERNKTESTGHGLPLDYSEGPLPLHLEMAAGKSSEKEMLSQIKRGLYVTRFHYIREVHPLKTMVTGMTRDGVFLVENGEVVARVKNFRFTESILGALSHVSGISKDRKLLAGDIDSGFPMATLAPKVLVDKFSFTGATRF